MKDRRRGPCAAGLSSRPVSQFCALPAAMRDNHPRGQDDRAVERASGPRR
jgi:hypothetical protein